MRASTDSNQLLYERDAQHYVELDGLDAAESTLFDRFATRWPEWNMLDLGVGAGRTATVFAPIVKSYVGVDYVPRMIELSRRRVEENETVQFAVCDARDLSRFHGLGFDFVLFSFNGIDSVDHENRLQILSEIRTVISNEGWFAFSSHSLDGLTFRVKVPSSLIRSPLRFARGLSRSLHKSFQRKWVNRGLDLNAARRRGWVVVRDDPAHDFELEAYFISPWAQVEQLRHAGFEVVELYDQSGEPVNIEDPRDDVWIYYLCKPQT